MLPFEASTVALTGMNGARHSPQPSAGHALLIALGVTLGVLFLWATIQVDFVIFAGVLLAIFLRGLADLVSRYAGFGPRWSLAVVVALIICVVGGFAYVFAETLLSQANELSTQLSAAAGHLRQSIANVPWAQSILSQANPKQLMSSGTVGGIFGVASNAVDLVGGIVLTCFFGLYMSAEPAVYERGLLALIPERRRARAARILANAADVLWHWMLGRLFSMTVVACFTTAGLWILGMPLPIALGLLAGVLTFVPYIGAIVSAVPSLIIALSMDPHQALYVVLLYVAVHILEGYILVPLVQRRASELPPATTLAAQLILGTLCGLIGVTFATPLAAATIPMVRMAWLEDDADAQKQAPRAAGWNRERAPASSGL